MKFHDKSFERGLGGHMHIDEQMTQIEALIAVFRMQ
jgi:hypothetical protein